MCCCLLDIVHIGPDNMIVPMQTKVQLLTIQAMLIAVVPVFCIVMHCGEYWAVVNKHIAQ